jgi:hypothetical protein
VLAAGKIDIGKPLKLRFAIGRDENAFAVFRELRPRIRNLLRTFGRAWR